MFLQKYIFVRKLIFLCVKKRQWHKALYDFSRSTEELMQVFRYLDNYKTFVAKCATRCPEMPVNDDRGASRYWVRTVFFIHFFFIFALANRRIHVRMTCVLVCAHPGGLPIMAFTWRLRPKGVSFSWKMVYERIRDLGAESPRREHA